MASHSWCQITPLTQSRIMSSENYWPPKCRCGHPTGHPKLLQLETPRGITWRNRTPNEIQQIWRRNELSCSVQRNEHVYSSKWQRDRQEENAREQTETI